MIIEKWPRDQLSRKIFVQQDGAKDHISENDMIFKEGLMEKGINGKLYAQAANSPDVNLLDLGFFRVIQSFNDAAPRNKEELIEVVSAVYESYPQKKLIVPGSPYNVASTR